jgi:small subunit ribosomal protein S20
MKQSEKRRHRNRATRSEIRSTVKAARAALGAKAPESKAAVLDAIRTVDRAVAKGVMHRNTAARRKSALARTLNTLA